MCVVREMADFVEYSRMMAGSCGASASDAGLIDALPDDVFMKCLVRVPLQWHANLQRASRGLREVVQSRQYYARRKAEGTSSSFVCLLQPMPMSTETLAEKSCTATPAACSLDSVYGISLVDVNENVWSRLPAIPGFPGGLPTYCRLVALKGVLVVLGGWWQSTWEPSKSVFVFNFSTQTWRQGADMTNVRNLFACGATGSKVYVAGGHDGSKKALASVEVYDVETNCWESLGSMREERDECTGVVMDGKFYVVSGYGSESQGVFSTSAEAYDYSTKTWSFIDNMWPLVSADSEVVNPSSLTALGGSLYGVHGKGVVVFNPQRNGWTVVEKVPEEPEQAEITSLSITATGNSLIITALAKKNDTATFRAISLTPSHGSCKPQWRPIAGDNQFLNLAQTSCAFEM